MLTINEMLGQFEHAALHPGQMLRQWKKETGGKAVGWLPIHFPEEIAHAAGMLPMGLWGGKYTTAQSSEYLQTFCCSIMKAVMELGLNGAYRELDAIVSPNTCDTMRCIPLMLRLAVPHPPVIGLVLPDNRKLESGVQFTADEYRKLADELVKVGGKKVNKANLEQSIEVYNQHHQTMLEFSQVAADHCDIITPYYRHMVIKSSFYMPKEKHTEWVLDLMRELRKLPIFKWRGKKVVLTGIMSEPYEILRLLEEYGYAVVGDDLAQGSRQFRTHTPDGIDPFMRLAKRFAYVEGCSCVHDPLKLRGKIINDMVSERQADGVVVLMMKFCDPEEYDYPYLKEDMENNGVPHVYIEIEQQMESLEQVSTRLQAFKEMLDV